MFPKWGLGKDVVLIPDLTPNRWWFNQKQPRKSKMVGGESQMLGRHLNGVLGNGADCRSQGYMLMNDGGESSLISSLPSVKNQT